MILSSSQIPNSLIRIHVIVRVAGNVFETKLEPDTNLRHTFAWDKRNIYNQKVYGIVDAEVSVGKKHALKKYDQFALNTSCFLGSTQVVQFHEISVTKIMNK